MYDQIKIGISYFSLSAKFLFATIRDPFARQMKPQRSTNIHLFCERCVTVGREYSLNGDAN